MYFEWNSAKNLPHGCRKNSGTIVKTFIDMFRGTHRRFSIWKNWRFMNIVEHCAKKTFGLLTKLLWDSLSKAHFPSPEENIQSSSFFWKKWISILSFGLKQRIFRFSTKLFGMLVRTAFYVSRRTFWGRWTLWRKNQDLHIISNF